MVPMNFYKDYFTAADFAKARNIKLQYARNRLDDLVRSCKAEFIFCQRDDSVRTYKKYKLF